MWNSYFLFVIIIFDEKYRKNEKNLVLNFKSTDYTLIFSVDLKNILTSLWDKKLFLKLLVDIWITSNGLKKSSFEIWKVFFLLFWRSSIFKSTEIASKVYKIHGTIFFMESNYISIFGVNISSNELEQVTLQNFDENDILVDFDILSRRPRLCQRWVERRWSHNRTRRGAKTPTSVVLLVLLLLLILVLVLVLVLHRGWETEWCRCDSKFGAVSHWPLRCWDSRAVKQLRI